jgi:hypothetical protein
VKVPDAVDASRRENSTPAGTGLAATAMAYRFKQQYWLIRDLDDPRRRPRLEKK